MIRINLAQAGRGPSASVSGGGVALSGDAILTTADLQKAGLIRLLVLIIFPAALYAYQEMTLPDLVAARNQKSTQLSQLRTYNQQMERAVQEIKKFKEDEAKIQSRINYLDRVSKGRLREIKIMELLQQIIPEKVWLTRLESTDGRLNVSGLAMTDYDISQFMEGLSKSAFFLDVNLLNSGEQNFDNLNVKRFEISCTMEKPGV